MFGRAGQGVTIIGGVSSEVSKIRLWSWLHEYDCKKVKAGHGSMQLLSQTLGKYRWEDQGESLLRKQKED